jgi:hypothetical protein
MLLGMPFYQQYPQGGCCSFGRQVSQTAKWLFMTAAEHFLESGLIFLN